jgi:hypothetical protein
MTSFKCLSFVLLIVTLIATIEGKKGGLFNLNFVEEDHKTPEKVESNESSEWRVIDYNWLQKKSNDKVWFDSGVSCTGHKCGPGRMCAIDSDTKKPTCICIT